MAFKELRQHWLGRPGERHEFNIGQSGKVRTIDGERFGHLAFVVDFLPRRRRHDPTHALHHERHIFRLIVIGVSDVLRHVGVIAEKGKIELLDGDGGIAHGLHPHIGEVDVEVPAEEAARGWRGVGVFVGPGCTAAYVAVTPSRHDAVVPGELLAQRTGRARQHLTGVGPGVVRPTNAGRPVGDPTVVHPYPCTSVCAHRGDATCENYSVS